MPEEEKPRWSFEDIIDCPRCEANGNFTQPLSPGVGYCRRCKLTTQEAKAIIENKP